MLREYGKQVTLCHFPPGQQNSTVNSAPSPSTLFALTAAPSLSQSVLTMYSPKPEPLAVPIAFEALKPCSNTCGRSAACIPMPLSLTLTVTLGLAEVSESEALSSAISRSDLALYEGKESGRNCFVINHS